MFADSHLYSGIDWVNLSIGISSQSLARSLSIEELFDTMPPVNCFGGILTSDTKSILNKLIYDQSIAESEFMRIFEIHKDLGDTINPLINGTDNYGRAIFKSWQ